MDDKASSRWYQDTRQGDALCGEGIIGVQEGLDHVIDGPAGLDKQVPQDDFNWLAWKDRLPLLRKNKKKRRLNFCFFLAVRNIAQNIGLSDCEECTIIRASLEDDIDPFGHILDIHDSFQGLLTSRPCNKVGVFPRENDQSMFILNIEGMELPQIAVECFVRLETAYRFLDPCSSELYLSTLKGHFRSLRTIVGGEGVLDSVGSFGVISSHLIKGDVQSGAEVVSSISDDQRKLGWNGFLGFDMEGSLTSLAVMLDDDFKRLLSKEGFDSGVEVIDVMAGPV